MHRVSERSAGTGRCRGNGTGCRAGLGSGRHLTRRHRCVGRGDGMQPIAPARHFAVFDADERGEVAAAGAARPDTSTVYFALRRCSGLSLTMRKEGTFAPERCRGRAFSR
ncbi:hypothetical protein GCM10018793_12160 [Streptomyces sulfonofaciens]|uniref:Uncharacterized protein n=1 Tax=Streptomyces sulfonofaciens TaxID=68272 RepID=A0A919FW22_9ACTN|nr:hypothetical protein GCM10018793_12160 [Streptomyces sulfonofaciens]